MKIQLFSLILGTICLFPLLGFCFENNSLRTPYPPFDHNKILVKADIKCPKTPPAVKNLVFKTIYTNRAHGVSIVDKKAQKKYKKQIKPIQYFEKNISKWIETYQTDGSHLNCAIQWLKGWAEQKSLLNGDVNFQGEAVRKWTLATLSSHYLQIRDAPIIDIADQKIIEEWLNILSKQVIKDYSRAPEKSSRQNNHIYWTAWAVMVTSVISNNTDDFNWAQKKFEQAMRDIEPDGTLPLEIARQGKAFNYHVFALNPLIMMAETIEKNGGDGYPAPLHRLVSRVLGGLDHQDYFEEKTGVKQDLTGTLTSGQLAWLEVYHTRFPHDISQKWINKLKPLNQRRIGGNITRLFSIVK